MVSRKKPLLISLIVVLLFTLLSFSSPLQAIVGQWSVNGSSIYYNDGNLGLGTSTPSQKLEILGNLRVNGEIYPGPFFHSNQKITTANWENGNLILSGSNHITAALGDNNGNGAFRVTHQSGSEILTVRGINYDGGETKVKVPNHLTISLGDNNGASKLRVTRADGALAMTVSSSGILRTKQIIVSNSWADYVFDEDYQLMSISELEQFIQDNKHLPGVPSAQEVEEQGLSLGDMQRIQMEKIEEQALYIIELENKVQGIEDRLSKLEELLL
jgi:hypothetical protein